MLPINFLRNTTFGDSSLHAAMAMSAASLSTRVSLVPAVNQAPTHANLQIAPAQPPINAARLETDGETTRAVQGSL